MYATDYILIASILSLAMFAKKHKFKFHIMWHMLPSKSNGSQQYIHLGFILPKKKNTVHYYGFYNGIVFILNKHFNEIFRWNANNCLVLDTRDMIRLIFKMKPIFFLTFQFFIFTFCITLWFFYFRWTLQVEALNLFLLVYWIIGKLLVTNYTDEY